jgi:uncharacterized membrane protein
MMRDQQPALSLFSVGMIGLGALSVVSRDFGYSWQPVPAFHPGREAFCRHLPALHDCCCRRGACSSARPQPSLRRLFFPFLVAWQLLRVPALFLAPQVEAVWLGWGEIAVLLAGGWLLFARFSKLDQAVFFRHITGDKGIRIARILFGVAVIPIGLGHIFYAPITATLVPAWMPFRLGLAYLTGFGQIACGLGVLFSVWARAAAYIETGMLALFAFLVWGPDTWFASTPKMAGSPTGPRFPLTAFLITWIIGASAWLVAANISSNRRR